MCEVEDLKSHIQALQESLNCATQKIAQLEQQKRQRVRGETFDIKPFNQMIHSLFCRIEKGSIQNKQKRNDRWYNILKDHWTWKDHIDHPTDYYIYQADNITRWLSPTMINLHDVQDMDAVKQLRYIMDFIVRARFSYQSYTPRWEQQTSEWAHYV